METLGTIIWFVLRVFILLFLLGLVVGTGVCGVGLFMYGGSSQAIDPGVWALVIGLAIATLVLAWVFWVVLRALFLKKPGNDQP
jgi:membrane protein implicated in regulation of membrane protease activity